MNELVLELQLIEWKINDLRSTNDSDELNDLHRSISEFISKVTDRTV